eukprot:7238727-Prymnesium_polylepis.2
MQAMADVAKHQARRQRHMAKNLPGELFRLQHSLGRGHPLHVRLRRGHLLRRGSVHVHCGGVW